MRSVIAAVAFAFAHRKTSAFDFRKMFVNSFQIVKILEPSLLSEQRDDINEIDE